MSREEAIQIPSKWLQALDIGRRNAPEVYFPNDPVLGSAHAGAIRDSFEKIGLSAIFCVQGVPTFAYLVQEEYDHKATADTHAKLWNQGLASLLLVISSDTLRIYSLAKLPVKTSDEDFDNKCLIETLTLAEHALTIKNLVSGAETGRLWREHKEFFKLDERIDTYLLKNLIHSHSQLTRELDTDAAQALLMQTMFIAYLEDRGIINSEYFLTIFEGQISSLHDVLISGNVDNLEELFKSLAFDFNGNVFVSPCSFDPGTEKVKLIPCHLDILARFRSGNEDLESGQCSFWGYDFQYIPVELISAVYDRFLGEKENKRKELGAYYTPMFLADTVMVQVWDQISSALKSKGQFLDPACGSGVFLVRAFQLLCEQWRLERNVQSIQWSNLCSILRRVHGWDINGNAVRVATFSLYIALLEQVSPPDIRKLIKNGKILPNLWGETLVEQDFFTVDANKSKFDVIVGNPPWTSRRVPNRRSIKWCKDNKHPMPSNEEAWAFTWKTLSHLQQNGLAAYLLPSMGILHNPESFSARAQLVKSANIFRIINFSDMRFQLFGGAVSPAALILFGINSDQGKPYNIEYWFPRASLNLQVKRTITMASTDKTSVNSLEIETIPSVLKTRLWMRRVDSKLYQYLSSLERLSDFIKPIGRVIKHESDGCDEWLIGQGFEAFNENSNARSNSPSVSQQIQKYPYLPVEAVNRLYQKTIPEAAWPTKNLRRKGFEYSYSKNKVLISRGVGTSTMRLNATYCDQQLTFKQILMAIVFPDHESIKAKILTAFLNSKLAIWYAFHGTPSFGAGRPEVKQAELLNLPFPYHTALSEDSKIVEEEILDIFDSLQQKSSEFLSSIGETDSLLSKIDRLIYRYFDLSEEEIAVIEDTVDYIIPAAQPHLNSIPYIWNPSVSSDRKEYTQTLVSELTKWLDINSSISAQLKGKNKDFALIELSLDSPQKGGSQEYTESNLDISSAITKLMDSANLKLSGNFALTPDFRLFIENKLYLVRPLNKQYWMKSTALEDADAIALDIQTHISSLKD